VETTPVKLRPLTTQREKMSPMVKAYWADLDQANEAGKPVAFCLGLVPQELFRAVDCSVYFGENFAAACAVARVSQQLCEAAEAEGYPIELCSYVRTNLGALITGKNPMGRTLPKPDVIAYLNGRCASYAGWGMALKDLFPDVPLFAIDVPPLRDGMTKDEYEDAQRYVVGQMRDVVNALDGWRGRRYDMDRLAEGVDNTGKGARAFLALQETLKTKPAPISLFDIFFQLFPFVCLRGRPEVAEYYTAATEEVKQRIADGYAAVPDEKFRIYWDGIAIWTRLVNQFNQLAKHNASLVAAAYTKQWVDPCLDYDGRRPLESLADGLLRGYMNMGLQDKVSFVEQLVRDYDTDGIIMQVSRSCKPMFIDEYAVTRQVSERTGVPFCEVNGDMADPRLYSEQEIETRIDAFLTRLAEG
jgi:benzoyl-CoA reductase/2-hydroxyglutaryl-CoA dehydratase subunit BcrC/BadD/HgdB